MRKCNYNIPHELAIDSIFILLTKVTMNTWSNCIYHSNCWKTERAASLHGLGPGTLTRSDKDRYIDTEKLRSRELGPQNKSQHTGTSMYLFYTVTQVDKYIQLSKDAGLLHTDSKEPWLIVHSWFRKDSIENFWGYKYVGCRVERKLWWTFSEHTIRINT